MNATLLEQALLPIRLLVKMRAYIALINTGRQLTHRAWPTTLNEHRCRYHVCSSLQKK